MKAVVLTGLRTNSDYHLGNYLGAILPMVNLQKKHLGDYQINMFAPDLHSFTTPVDHKKLFSQTMENLRVFVAAGMPIENDSFQLYRQSFIPAHSELTVILNNFTYFGELSRMTQFREKSYVQAGGKAKNSTLSDIALQVHNSGSGALVGLFDYPVLMAADILLYGAKYVPLGDDQRQHLELTRDIAIRINSKFGDIFTVPEPWSEQLVFSGIKDGVRVRSLRNPESKMSKSIDDPSGTIFLNDDPSEASDKVMKAETDSVGSINWDWEKQPGITNLLQISELLGGLGHDEVMSKWASKTTYGDLKAAVASQVKEFLEMFQANLAKTSESSVLAKLELSEAAMSAQANQTLLRVQKAIGLRG